MTMESLIGSDIDPEGFPDIEDTIHYTNDYDLRRALRVFFENAIFEDSLGDHTIVVTGFPTESFLVDDNNSDNDNNRDTDNCHEPPVLRKRKALYFERSKILILTMLGPPHEIASRQFAAELFLKLQNMNCRREVPATGGATRPLTNVSKEPDESWGPRGTGYITFAVESGVSESARALQCDAKIWLEHPESHVTQVVTIKISRVMPQIIFSVWKITPEEGGAGAQQPRRAGLDHQVHVTLAHGRPAASGTLCLSFEQFFERRARQGTSERDMVFSKRELGGIARDVWGEMGHMH
jgi:hypothetical protein